MIILTPIKARDMFKLKKVLKLTGTDLYNFHSEIPKFFFLAVLSGRCYAVNKNEALQGVLFLGSGNEVYYRPVSKGLTFFDILYAIYKNIDFKYLTLKIGYSKLCLNQYKKFFHIKISSDIKKMLISTSMKSIDMEKPELFRNISLRNLKVGSEEAIRVELQNLIFGNQEGRENLTLEEVSNEQKSQRFIGDKCFILEKEGFNIGYGQIIYFEKQFHLVNFGIIPSERRKGLGEYFLRSILSECEKSKITKVYLTVDNNNASAVNLYTRLGFKEISNQASLILLK